MQKIYRILRDNKEKGPFTLQELLDLNLKSFDLIWIEGRSAGWRYPSEIESLKPYLEDNTNVKQEGIIDKAATSHPASDSIRPPVTLISEQDTLLVKAPAPVSGTETELTPEQLEKKAAEIYQRIQSYNENKAQEKNETQTKYARSLEDLKQEYADWFHKKKEKKGIKLNKKAVGSFSVIAALFLGWFLVSGKSKSNDSLINSQTKRYISNAVFSQQNTPPGSSGKDASIQPASNQIKGLHETKNQKELSVDQFIDSVENVLSKDNITLKKTKPVSHKNPVFKVKETKDKVPALEVAVPDIKKMPLSQLISMNAHYMYDADQKLFGLEVTIQNKSMQLLKKVTVDVFYYKKGDKLFDKETLYFNNIQPGNSFTL
ncbi:MAG TPA: hypothetical protein VGO09_05330, partial [Flavisolibacter sp.]|nr:hypothetical protein [Flavisolibacter sp.]